MAIGPGAQDMLRRGVVDTVMATLADKKSNTQKEALMLLSNLSRSVHGSERLMQTHVEGLAGLHMRKLLNWYLSSAGDKKDSWDLVAYIIFNVSQIQEGRDFMRRRSTDLLAQILPQLRSDSVLRRRGTAGTIYNLCFEEEDHYWLLNELKIVPHLLYPLCGPEELTLEDKTGMDPVLWIETWTMATTALLKRFCKLQGEDKERETDEEVIQILLKALLLLCTSRRGREKLRDEKVYIIIRNMDLALTEQEEESKKADGNGDDEQADSGTYVPTIAEQEVGTSDLIYKLVNMLQGDEEYRNRAEADEADKRARDARLEEKSSADAPKHEELQQTGSTSAKDVD
eukprot:scaffold1610_cov257-Pinguiococcus_pyrenoidosus.AAC.16